MNKGRAKKAVTALTPVAPAGNESAKTEQSLRYDKGDRRKKHISTAPYPVIEYDERQPRRLVGKCPKGLEKEAADILATSIAGLAGDRPGGYAKHRYAVHKGSIYEAATSDRGETYHGYPYHGKLARGLIEELRKQAADQSCEDAFEQWVKDHITVHGSWKP